MATYLKEQHQLLANNTTFRQRVGMGFFAIAREVLSDPAPDPVAEHQRNFARRIILETDVTARGYVAAIATDPDVVAAAVAAYTAATATERANNPDLAQAGVSDDLILAAIRQAWPVLSDTGAVV